MENRIGLDFIGDIPRKNTSNYVFSRLVIRFSLIFVLSFVSGILFCIATSGAFSKNTVYSGISAHFTDVFEGCEGIKDCFSVLIAASTPHFRNLFLIFAAGFTYFCGLAASAVLVFRGFTVGFCFTYLIDAINNGKLALPHPYAAAILFMVTELLLSAAMIVMCVRSKTFSYEFRRLRGRKSMVVRSPVIYNYLFIFLTAFGLILIINTLGCLLSKLIYG